MLSYSLSVCGCVGSVGVGVCVSSGPCTASRWLANSGTWRHGRQIAFLRSQSAVPVRLFPQCSTMSGSPCWSHTPVMPSPKLLEASMAVASPPSEHMSKLSGSVRDGLRATPRLRDSRNSSSSPPTRRSDQTCHRRQPERFPRRQAFALSWAGHPQESDRTCARSLSTR